MRMADSNCALHTAQSPYLMCDALLQCCHFFYDKIDVDCGLDSSFWTEKILYLTYGFITHKFGSLKNPQRRKRKFYGCQLPAACSSVTSVDNDIAPRWFERSTFLPATTIQYFEVSSLISSAWLGGIIRRSYQVLERTFINRVALVFQFLWYVGLFGGFLLDCVWIWWVDWLIGPCFIISNFLHLIPRFKRDWSCDFDMFCNMWLTFIVLF